MLFRDLSQGSKFSNAGVREDDIDSPLRFDGLVKAIQVRQFGNVSLNARNVAAVCLHGIVDFLLATARNEDIGAPPDEQLSRPHPYPGSAARDDRHFSL